jgi:hypothetical protein
MSMLRAGFEPTIPPSVRAVQDHKLIRPHSHWDRQETLLGCLNQGRYNGRDIRTPNKILVGNPEANKQLGRPKRRMVGKGG